MRDGQWCLFYFRPSQFAASQKRSDCLIFFLGVRSCRKSIGKGRNWSGCPNNSILITIRENGILRLNVNYCCTHESRVFVPYRYSCTAIFAQFQIHIRLSHEDYFCLLLAHGAKLSLRHAHLVFKIFEITPRFFQGILRRHIWSAIARGKRPSVPRWDLSVHFQCKYTQSWNLSSAHIDRTFQKRFLKDTRSE